MRALVTGGSGYLGEILVDKLLATGAEVRVLDIIRNYSLHEDVEFIEADICDSEKVAAACGGVDTIFHAVAQVPIAKDKRLFWKVNYDGMRNLLNCAQKAKVRKIVYISSSAIFGIPRENPVLESTPPAPMEDYGRAKHAAEVLCLESGLDVSIVRPRTILGSGRLGIFQILFEWVRLGRNIPVLGPGDNIYQFIHVKDLAKACILAGQQAGSEIYNCGTDRFGTMRELLERLCIHANSGSKVVSVNMRLAEIGMQISSSLGLSPLGSYHSLMYGRSLYFDIQKAQKHLKWRPEYSNHEMLIESYEWYVQNREKIFADTGRSAHRSPLKEKILGYVPYFL